MARAALLRPKPGSRKKRRPTAHTGAGRTMTTASRPMTVEQLVAVMIFHLESLSGQNGVDRESVPGKVLKDNKSKLAKFRQFITSTLERAGINDAEWPEHWEEMKASLIAGRLLKESA